MGRHKAHDSAGRGEHGGRRGRGAREAHGGCGARGGREASCRATGAREAGGLQKLDDQTGLPAFVVEGVRQQYGETLFARVAAGWRARRRVSLRANVLKATRDDICRELSAASIAWQAVPWYADALVLGPKAHERDVQALAAYEEGLLYLQSLSSMLPPLVLAPRPGADVLDMCAAPGGKTSQMATLARGGAGMRPAHICACERSWPRAERLEHNLAKLGVENVQLMRCDARKLDEWFRFDQVLLDAPCTGSGTLRAGDARVARSVTPELAERLERTQRGLIDKGLSVLKEGGELVYSTCSVLARENEDIVAWALKRHPECELVDVGLAGAAGADWLAGAADTLALPRLPSRLPHTLTLSPTELYEGFFVAKLVKRG